MKPHPTRNFSTSNAKPGSLENRFLIFTIRFVAAHSSYTSNAGGTMGIELIDCLQVESEVAQKEDE
jgi:hypothetical protein